MLYFLSCLPWTFSLLFYIPFLIYSSSATTGLHSSHRATASLTNLSHEIPRRHDVPGEVGMTQILDKIDQIEAGLQAIKGELNETHAVLDGIIEGMVTL